LPLLVDAQSFPFASDSSPEIVKGAYSPQLTYSPADIKTITDNAIDRAVRVIFEIDVPGHAASWAAGYPNTMADCFAKLTPIQNVNSAFLTTPFIVIDTITTSTTLH